MEIRKKLTLQFVAIVALILFLAYLGIYISFSSTRKRDFFDRLGSKATMVAQMLIEIDEIDEELLKRIESNNPLSLPNEKIIIYDYQNQIIFSTDQDNYLKIPDETIDEVRINEVVRLKQGPYEILGQFYTSRYDRFVVFSAATDIYGLRKLKRLRIILFAFFSGSLVITFFSGNLFSSRALKPMSDIMTQVNSIGESNLHLRVDEGTGMDEISRLAQTFNRMLERIEVAFRTQKSFIANASHEMRTPLTAITLQLEVTLMKARTNAEYRGSILSVLDDIRNLNQISNRLLMLAQAGSEFQEADFSPVRIDDILWKARKEILKLHPDYRINVTFSEMIDNELRLTVIGNELLLKTAMVNLMDNGCKYSPDLTSDVMISHNDAHSILIFTNSGAGISPDEISMIFQPFYRAKNAIGIKGHGIGLSLVEKIIQTHKGTIKVSSDPNTLTKFIISISSQA